MQSSNKLRKRAITALAVIVLVALAGQAATIALLSRPAKALSSHSAAYAQTADQALKLAVLQKLIQIDVIQVQQFLTDVSATRGLDGLDDGFQLADEHAASFRRNIAEAKVLAGELKAVDVLDELAKVGDAFPDFYSEGRRMAQAYVSGGPAAGNAMMSGFDAAAEKMGAAIDAEAGSVDAILAQLNQQGQAARGESDQGINTAMSLAGIIVLATIMLGAGCALMIVRQLLNPLAATTAALNDLAAGRQGLQLAGAERVDEMGALARAFVSFKQQGEEKTKAEAEAALRRQEIERERDQNETLQKMALEEQQTVSTEIGHGLAKLAQGDLSHRIVASFPEAYAKLKDDFNAAMRSIEATMSTIMVSSQAIRSEATDISRAAEDLSRRTEQQAASLEETAAAVSHITATTRRNAEGANQARQLAETAKVKAEDTGHVVDEAVTAMAGIESASRQISGIVGVIDEIAFQTNLLALNAGVEAARAGESGRGFAVVAQEVRALAQRSASAAKEIKDLISSSNSQVNHGVDLVSRSGKSLAAIIDQINGLAETVGGISTATQEQAASLAEVNIAVGQMDQMTQQNAAIAEQSTAASVNLMDNAEGLAQQIGQFVVRATASERPSMRALKEPKRLAA